MHKLRWVEGDKSDRVQGDKSDDSEIKCHHNNEKLPWNVNTKKFLNMQVSK